MSIIDTNMIGKAHAARTPESRKAARDRQKVKDPNPYASEKKLAVEPLLPHLKDWWVSKDGAQIVYWRLVEENGTRRYEPMTEKVALESLVSSHGARKCQEAGETFSQAKWALIWLRDNKEVAGTISLAGYRAGIIEDLSIGRPRLIIDQAKQIKPVKGKFPTVKGFIDSMLGHEPARYLHAWSAEWLKGTQHGHMLLFLGDTGCGKSVLQDIVLTPLLGRSANAFAYMSGNSPFNGECTAAEHLHIDDNFCDPRYLCGELFQARVKEVTVSKSVVSHAKYKSPVKCSPRQRATLSMNKEPHNLEMLPQLHAEVKEKVMVFDCKPTGFLQREAAKCGGEDGLEKKIRAELPAYAYWLRNEFDYTDLMDARHGLDRFRIRPWHDEELLREIQAATREQALFEILQGDAYLFHPQLEDGPVPTKQTWERSDWVGTAPELFDEMQGSAAFKSIVRTPNGLGKMLANVSSIYLDKVFRHSKSNNDRRWVIKKPVETR
jgi:hypothetical protein